MLLTTETSKWGYIVEVSLTQPKELHDYFADYPLAPSREVVDICALCNEQVDMLGNLGITLLPKVPKLLQTFHPKEGLVLHYLTVKLYHSGTFTQGDVHTGGRSRATWRKYLASENFFSSAKVTGWHPL